MAPLTCAGIPAHMPSELPERLVWPFPPFFLHVLPIRPYCGVAGKAYVKWPSMCFLIRCKRGPRPHRQGDHVSATAAAVALLPSLSTSVPSSPAHLETLSPTRSWTEQIGGIYAISCCRAQGADALSPNRFSCYQLGG